MQKVSFSFPPEVIEQLDHERGTLSRNRFVLRLLKGALQEEEEKSLHRITAEVYGDSMFAQQEEQLARIDTAHSGCNIDCGGLEYLIECDGL